MDKKNIVNISSVVTILILLIIAGYFVHVIKTSCVGCGLKPSDFALLPGHEQPTTTEVVNEKLYIPADEKKQEIAVKKVASTTKIIAYDKAFQGDENTENIFINPKYTFTLGKEFTITGVAGWIDLAKDADPITYSSSPKIELGIATLSLIEINSTACSILPPPMVDGPSGPCTAVGEQAVRVRFGAVYHSVPKDAEYGISRDIYLTSISTRFAEVSTPYDSDNYDNVFTYRIKLISMDALKKQATFTIEKFPRILAAADNSMKIYFDVRYVGMGYSDGGTLAKYGIYKSISIANEIAKVTLESDKMRDGLPISSLSDSEKLNFKTILETALTEYPTIKYVELYSPEGIIKL